MRKGGEAEFLSTITFITENDREFGKGIEAPDMSKQLEALQLALMVS